MKRQNVKTSKRQHALPHSSRRCGGLHTFDVWTFGRLDVSSRRGFTLLEMIVVILIIVLLTSITVPRFVGNNDRMFRNTCDAVADLLTMYAQRDAMGQKPVGLLYDANRHWLVLTVYDIDLEDGGRHAEWRWDNLVPPVKLPEFAELVEVLMDGDQINITQWPLATRPGSERPAIEVTLQGPSEIVTIALPPYAMAPRQFRGGEEAYGYLTREDLNLSGRMRVEW